MSRVCRGYVEGTSRVYVKGVEARAQSFDTGFDTMPLSAIQRVGVYRLAYGYALSYRSHSPGPQWQVAHVYDVHRCTSSPGFPKMCQAVRGGARRVISNSFRYKSSRSSQSSKVNRRTGPCGCGLQWRVWRPRVPPGARAACTAAMICSALIKYCLHPLVPLLLNARRVSDCALVRHEDILARLP